MAESIAEQIAEKVVAALGAIAADGGTTYWLTPRVARAGFYTELSLDRSEGSTLYIVRPGEAQNRERSSGGHYDSTLELWLSLVTEHEGTENPFQSTGVSGWTLQNRMLRDAKVALGIAWATWGLGVYGFRFAQEDLEEYVEGWAVVHARLEVDYHYRVTAP